MNFIKANAVALVAVLIAIGGYFYPQLASISAGAVVTGPAHYQTEGFIQGLCSGLRNQWCVDGNGNVSSTGTLSVGTNGSTLTRLNFSVGVAIGYSNTIAASSTGTFDIGPTTGKGQVGSTLPGVSAGDQCDVYATTTIGNWGGLDIISSFASTTNGYCSVTVFNQTGATFTWSSTASSSFAYQVFH